MEIFSFVSVSGCEDNTASAETFSMFEDSKTVRKVTSHSTSTNVFSSKKPSMGGPDIAVGGLHKMAARKSDKAKINYLKLESTFSSIIF